jgi:hypothetical protein
LFWWILLAVAITAICAAMYYREIAAAILRSE